MITQFPQRPEEGEALERRLREFWHACDSRLALLAAADPHGSWHRQRAFAWITGTREGNRLLDVGCGAAPNAALCNGHQYIGMELGFRALQEAPPRAGRRVCGDLEQLPFRDCTFDSVLETFVLEHLVHPMRALREMCRVARPGGRIILLGPTWDFPFWYPNALRGQMQDRMAWVWYTLQRAWGQLRGVLSGVWPLVRVTEPEALRATEFIYDTDVVYVVWTYEVIQLMQAMQCRLIYWEVDDRLLGLRPLVRGIKRLLMRLPVYRYAGSTVLLVFERR